jgi:hypothetical protein
MEILAGRSADYPDRVYPLVLTIPDDATPDKPTLALHAFHYMLEQKLREFDTGPGDRLTVVYLGKQEGKRANNQDYPTKYAVLHKLTALSKGPAAFWSDYDN